MKSGVSSLPVDPLGIDFVDRFCTASVPEKQPKYFTTNRMLICYQKIWHYSFFLYNILICLLPCVKSSVAGSSGVVVPIALVNRFCIASGN